VAEPLGSGEADAETTLVEEGIIVCLGQRGMELDLRRELVRDRWEREDRRIIDDVEFGEVSVEALVPTLDRHVGLDDGPRITPEVLARRDNRLRVVLPLGHDLVDRGPPYVANLGGEFGEDLLCLMCLDPDLIHQAGIRSPRCVGPLGIGDPNGFSAIGHE
jgi:hypothetical protein